MKIRDKDFNTVRTATSLTSALQHPSRLLVADIWDRGPRGVTLGFAWEDGATAIGDFVMTSFEMRRRLRNVKCEIRLH